MLTSSSFSLFIGVYSTEPSKVIGYSYEVSNFNRLEHLHQLLRTHWEWRCWVLFTTDTPHQQLLGVASELRGSIYVARHDIRDLFHASGSHCIKLFLGC